MAEDAAKIETLVGWVFAIRNAAHLAHWKTKSYAQHKALDEFYNGVIEDIDAIVEAYQGVFGLIGDVEIPTVSGDIVRAMTTELNWIETARDKIAKGDTTIQNLIDDLRETYATTLYKLKNLS